MSHCRYPSCNDTQNKSHGPGSCLPKVRYAKLFSPKRRSAKYCNYTVETYCTSRRKISTRSIFADGIASLLLCACRGGILSRTKIYGKRNSMQQAQIVERWLIYGVKWTQKHVCVIHVSRERKCMRSNVARPTKGQGKNCKLKLAKSNCELIFVEENFAFFIRPGQRLQICIG